MQTFSIYARHNGNSLVFPKHIDAIYLQLLKHLFLNLSITIISRELCKRLLILPGLIEVWYIFVHLKSLSCDKPCLYMTFQLIFTLIKYIELIESTIRNKRRRYNFRTVLN